MIILNKNTYYRQSTYRGREKNNTDLLHQIYEKTNLFNMWRKHDVH